MADAAQRFGLRGTHGGVDRGCDAGDAQEDQELAARCAEATLLITATCSADVETVARRIHSASDRAASPFVHVAGSALPADAAILVEACGDLLDRARGGSLLVSDVERMPAVVQNQLMETIVGLQRARAPSGGVRLIAGTTTTLHERVADGMFSERLFYRLNTIHVVATNAARA
jgi:DNA-binding NtrC family response regulator